MLPMKPEIIMHSVVHLIADLHSSFIELLISTLLILYDKAFFTEFILPLAAKIISVIPNTQKSDGKSKLCTSNMMRLSAPSYAAMHIKTVNKQNPNIKDIRLENFMATKLPSAFKKMLLL